MDYEEIGELIGEIKYRYIETGQWDSVQCARLLELTEHVPMIVGRKRGVHPDDLGDIVQLSYQAAFKHLSMLSDDRSFPRYLYTIADNLCRKYWKRKLRQGHQESLFFDDGHVKKLECDQIAYENLGVRENLRDAVGQLPDLYRESIEMFYFAGMRASEMAQVLNVSIHTVTSRVRRARNMLKDMLEA